jgi:hypothetical protein
MLTGEPLAEQGRVLCVVNRPPPQHGAGDLVKTSRLGGIMSGRWNSFSGYSSKGVRLNSCACRRSSGDGMPWRDTRSWPGGSTISPGRALPIPRRLVRSYSNPRRGPPCRRCSSTATRLRPRLHSVRWCGVSHSSAGSSPGRGAASPASTPSGRAIDGCTNSSIPKIRIGPSMP